VASLAGLTFVLGALPLGLLGDRVHRLRLTALCAAVAAVSTALTAGVSAVWQLAAARLVTGAGQASILPVNNSLLADGYPVAARSAVFSVHGLMPSLGYVVGPLVAGATAAAVGGPEGWRAAFVVLGVLSGIAAAFALLQREPLRGRGRPRPVVGDEEAERLAADRALDPPVALGPAVQRLLAVRTLFFLLVGIGVLGFSLVSVPTFFGLLLEEEYGPGPAGSRLGGGRHRGPGHGGHGRRRRPGRSAVPPRPPRAVLLVAASSAGFAVVLPLALYAPGGLAVLVLGVGLAKLLQSVGSVPVYVFVAAVVPTRLRSLGYALLGIYVLLLGGLLGNVLTGLVSDARGPRFALAVVSVPGQPARGCAHRLRRPARGRRPRPHRRRGARGAAGAGPGAVRRRRAGAAGARPSTPATGRCRCCSASTSTSPRARCSPCSAPTARASRPCSAR
jgi:MFS family permease